MLIGRYSHARMAPTATVGPRPPLAGPVDRGRWGMPVSEAFVVAGSVAAIGAAAACARRSRRAPGGGLRDLERGGGHRADRRPADPRPAGEHLVLARFGGQGRGPQPGPEAQRGSVPVTGATT